MIIEKYAEGVRALTTDQLALVTSSLMSAHPEYSAPFIPESGSDLVAFCLTHRISQAELIMPLARATDAVGVGALESLLCRPIDRITPASLRRAEEERETTNKPSPRTPSRTTDPRFIRLLVAENPKREGTSAHVHFALYRDGMSVSDFLAAGGTSGDLKWDASKNFIRLEVAA